MAEAKRRRTVSGPAKYRGPLTYIVKAAGDGKSHQIKDPFAEMYGANGIAIEPLLSPDKLLIVMEENAIHSACVQAKASDAVGRGWRLENKDPLNEDKSKEEDLRDLLEDLTPEWSFSELLRQAAEEEESIGWSAWECVREGDYGTSDINAIFPMPAHTLRMTRIPGVYVQIRNYVKRYFVEFGYDKGPMSATRGVDGDGKPIAPVSDDDMASEVILFRTYASRTMWYGIPRWLSALPALAELTAIREYNISWFASGGTTDRIVHISGPDDESAQAVADDVKTQLEEASGRGHVTIITHSVEGVKPEVIFLTQAVGARDGQFMKRRDDLQKEVLLAHQVPGYRIGLVDEGALGGTAAPDMLHSYKIGVVEPLQTIIEDRLAHTLFGDKGLNLGEWKWVLSDLDWDETTLDLAVATGGVQAGIITPNEARHMLKQDRYDAEEADMLYYQGQPIASDNEGINDAMGVIGQFKDAITAAKNPKPQFDPATGKQLKPGQKVPGANDQPGQPAPARKFEDDRVLEAITKAAGASVERPINITVTAKDENVELAKESMERSEELTRKTVGIVGAAAAESFRRAEEMTDRAEKLASTLTDVAAVAAGAVAETRTIATETKGLVEKVATSVDKLSTALTEDPGELQYDANGRPTGFKKKN